VTSVQKLKLKRNHSWKSKPGYSICVLDRGLVRFDYPSGWVVESKDGAVYLHDLEPSIESCDLGVSIFRVPPEVAAALPMEELLVRSLDTDRKPYQQSEPRRLPRQDVEIVWLEQHYLESTQNRDARFRVALASGPVICLVSMNYWSNRAGKLEPVWDNVLRTLQLSDEIITDPTKGPVVQ
jgi:hypothetical protein